jgi:hypothetical protein
MTKIAWLEQLTKQLWNSGPLPRNVLSMNSELSTPNRWRFVAAAALILGAWPMRYLAAPRWEVWVSSHDGQPITKMNVRLVYQNYSVEGKSHELTLMTDENGYVLFPQQNEKACVFQRVLYTVLSARAGVHASFGRHAYAFAGTGYELDLGDWHGSPESMQSRIVIKRRPEKPI